MASLTLPASTSALQLVDAVRRGAELVAPMNQRHALRQRLQVERPVEGRIAAADDKQVVAAVILHATHRIEDRGALIVLDARHRRPLRLERSAAGGDHHHLAEKGGAGVGGEPESPVRLAAERLDHLGEMEGRMEGMNLLHQLLDQVLAGDDRIAGDVVDRLLRIELGALAARPVENVDQGAADIEQAELEDGEQADRPGADDDHVGLYDLGLATPVHARVIHSARNPCSPCGGHITARSRRIKATLLRAQPEREQNSACARAIDFIVDTNK